MELEDYTLFASLGDYFKYVRKSYGITMTDLASTSGVSQPYLSLIENNKNAPSEEVIEKLSQGIQKLVSEDIQKDLQTVFTEAKHHFHEKRIKQAFVDINTSLSKDYEIKKAKETLNMNYVLDYFETEKEIEENFLKRESGDFIDPNDRFYNYIFLLDEKELSPKEIQVLRTVLLGIRETRNEKD